MRNKIMRLVIMDHFRLIDWLTTLLIVKLIRIDMIIIMSCMDDSAQWIPDLSLTRTHFGKTATLCYHFMHWSVELVGRWRHPIHRWRYDDQFTTIPWQRTTDMTDWGVQIRRPRDRANSVAIGRCSRWQKLWRFNRYQSATWPWYLMAIARN